MDPILELAREHGLKVIEDCAQALGAVYKGRPVGSMGDVKCLLILPGQDSDYWWRRWNVDNEPHGPLVSRLGVQGSRKEL